MDVNKSKMAKRVAAILAIAIAVLLAAGVWYVSDYSHADETAMAALAGEGPYSADGVSVRELPDGAVAFAPAKPVAGLVFYPGAKVQPEAYAPLMRQLAAQGVLTVLVKPPFNLAILDTEAAASARGQFPDIDTWAIAGHSMGGVAASDYVSRHKGESDALVLLASYSAVDLSDYEGAVLSLSGSEDGVLNREKAEEARSLLPAAAVYVIVDGGNHANYGNYGAQDHDGVATISRERQQAQTVEAIVGLLRAR